MAPQQTFYGSVPMDSQKEERPSRFLRRAAITTGVVMVVALAAFTLSSSPAAPAKATASVDVAKKFTGDCTCIDNKCPSAPGITYCAVLDRNCMGTNNDVVTGKDGKSVHKADKAGDVDCKCDLSTTKVADCPCKAVCDVVVGENQCNNDARNPTCKNGGWCKDGKGTYKCFCKTGWHGKNCEKDIKECELGGKDAVCDKNAKCFKDEGGEYRCKCNGGWQGLGYADEKKIPSWMTATYNKQKSEPGFKYGCGDIDDCFYLDGRSRGRCKHGKCVNQEGKTGDAAYNCECNTSPRTGLAVWMGRKCDVNVNECAKGKNSLNDCDSKAECNDLRAEGKQKEGFSCTCKKGWTSSDTAGKDHKGIKTKKTRGCYDINDCEPNPCKNGGKCRQTTDACGKGYPEGTKCFVCDCPLGWSGDTCEKDENECKDSMSVDPKTGKQKTKTPLAPCKDVPSATCHNTAGSYGCRCNLGWTGDGIECVDANDCETNPCAHGGTCEDCGTLCFSCKCVLGWRGATCGTDWNECLMGIHRCHDSATCLNTPGSYTCRCDTGFTGNGIGSERVEKLTYTQNGKTKTKVVQHGCKDIDDCDPKEYDGTGRVAGWDPTWNHGPCKYGTCRDLGPGFPASYHCTCWDGWTDSNCNTNINECDSTTGSNECHAKATCIDLPGAGDPSKKPTIKDGKSKCSDGPFKTNKLCRKAGMGKRIEGGKCADADAKKCTAKECCEEPSLYQCKCNAGFKGDGYGCEDVPDCFDGACNKGFCTDLGASQYKCTCEQGWEDSDCSKNINECTAFTHECADTADCVDTEGSYMCQCPPGTVQQGQSVGKKQECEDIDDCQSKKKDAITGKEEGKCGHGTCVDTGANSYKCVCDPGWTDHDCKFDINECQGKHSCWKGGFSNELHHLKLGKRVRFGAATCVNTPGSYICRCPRGMIGQGKMTDKKESFHKSYKYIKRKEHGVGLEYSKVGGKVVKKEANLKDQNHGCTTTDGKGSCLILPTGCVDYDDCSLPGQDKIYGTKDKGEGPDREKCGPRGTCQDDGANKHSCKCEKGYCGAASCDRDCDECADGTHDCNTAQSTCQNTPGSFVCVCNHPKTVNGAGGFFGPNSKNGNTCLPCTVCGNGYRTTKCPVTVPAREITKDGKKIKLPAGQKTNECEDIDECREQWREGGDWYGKGKLRDADPCHHGFGKRVSLCVNTPGSFTCKCIDGYYASTPKKDARWVKREPACTKCTRCRDGFHIVAPCTATSDTVCQRDVPAYVPAYKVGGKMVPFDHNTNSGLVIIKTEADGNLQCLTIKDGDWFPSRLDMGGIGQCGANTQKQWIEQVKPKVMWSFTALGDNSDRDEKRGITDLYLIRQGGKTGACLFFGNGGKDLYPSLQHCRDYENGKCPWSSPKGAYCGYAPSKAGMSSRDGILQNKQAVWKVTTLKLSENKFILQSAARSAGKKYECLVFEKQGTETNPSRYNWGNGDRLCGVGNWGDTTLAMALMENKQAVFMLESYAKFEHSKLQKLRNPEWHAARAAKVAGQ